MHNPSFNLKVQKTWLTFHPLLILLNHFMHRHQRGEEAGEERGGLCTKANLFLDSKIRNFVKNLDVPIVYVMHV